MSAPPSTSTSRASVPPKPGVSGQTARRRRGEASTAYLFILPALLLIAVFGLFPIGYSLYMSLYNWRVRQGEFAGLDNYKQLLGGVQGPLAFVAGLALILLAHWLWTGAFQGQNWFRWLRLPAALALMAAGVTIALGWNVMVRSGDAAFLQSLIVTLYYAVLSIPVQIVFALILAALLYRGLPGQGFFRSLYFLPYVMPVVATAAVFRAIFSPRDTSLANTVLGWLHVAPQGWLFDPRPLSQVLFGWQLPGVWAGPSMALATVVLFGIWTFVGYNVVIFLAGLTGIPKDLYEAAEIDGAGAAAQFLYITVPMLSPVIFYVALVGLIGALQAFNHIYVMRVPSAQGTVDSASVYIFDTFYQNNNYGLAAAESFILFFLILALTLFQFRFFGRKVFYG
ncbi:carbohydrate ABC transporter permease [Deinococcus sp.]|uniref:carbohydrate ABC transporter permease n=1 Tax=Deinococcus sp. TaxID=47478 RepID=UPI003C7E2587